MKPAINTLEVVVRSLCATVMAVLLMACGEQSAPESEQTTETQPAVEAQSAESKELVVYSARNEHLIKPLFDRFTEQTGININFITDKEGPLLTRLKAEGENSPADLLITVDAGNLWHAAQEGVLAATESEVLEARVPAHLQDEENRWYAVSIRARTMIYNTDKVNAEELSTYEALAGEDWNGRLCLRTSKKVYNQSLVATMIASMGEQEAEQIVSGWVGNLASDPFSNDTKVMEAIAAGQCDVGIVNTYYYGRLMKQNPELPLAIFWPNQEGGGFDQRGVHINVSGAGVTSASKNKAEALQFIEWMAGNEAQTIMMELNQEYPVSAETTLTEELAAWGRFKADSINVAKAGELQADAVKLMDRVGYK